MIEEEWWELPREDWYADVATELGVELSEFGSSDEVGVDATAAALDEANSRFEEDAAAMA